MWLMLIADAIYSPLCFNNTPTRSDCCVFSNGNADYGVTIPKNYGPAFDDNGGWCVKLASPQNESWTLFSRPVCRYAMEHTRTFIKMWSWTRNAGHVPPDVRSSSSGWINTDAWGTPTANFQNTQCDIDKKFSDSNTTINLTFCGSHSILTSWR
jgi:hypothetical protein